MVWMERLPILPSWILPITPAKPSLSSFILINSTTANGIVRMILQQDPPGMIQDFRWILVESIFKFTIDELVDCAERFCPFFEQCFTRIVQLFYPHACRQHAGQ